jgi:hypothetical protein
VRFYVQPSRSLAGRDQAEDPERFEGFRSDVSEADGSDEGIGRAASHSSGISMRS